MLAQISHEISDRWIDLRQGDSHGFLTSAVPLNCKRSVDLKPASRAGRGTHLCAAPESPYNRGMLIDTHCHLSYPGLIEDLDGVLLRARAEDRPALLANEKGRLVRG